MPGGVDSTSFDGLLLVVELLSLLIWSMFLSLPVVAFWAAVRRWRQRRSVLVPGLALLAWGVEAAAAFAYFLSGRWYREGSSGTSLADVAGFVLVVAAVAVPWVAALRALAGPAQPSGSLASH